ncbi:hypothetical protein [Halobacterium zhouii]|uniref:hypothetical protein n=1 Tax=Halobacterium zhouii TaxID=2902624 RepID=UPI001E4F13BD|nr:hypothetical protein [Halobacterium zhouii]
MSSTVRHGVVHVDSRWWYWVVAVPTIAALWALSALWLVGVVLVVPQANATTGGAIVSIPAVALGVPALVAFLVLPFALLVDARAVRDAGSDWPEDPGQPAQFAAAADAVIVAGVLVFFEVLDFTGPRVRHIEPLGVTPQRLLGMAVILVGVAAGSLVCVRYVRERREHVAMPRSLREWREELRAA